MVQERDPQPTNNAVDVDLTQFILKPVPNPPARHTRIFEPVNASYIFPSETSLVQTLHLTSIISLNLAKWCVRRPVSLVLPRSTKQQLYPARYFHWSPVNMTAAPTPFTSGSTPFLSGSPYTPEPGTSEQKKFRPEPTEADLEEMAKKLGMPLDDGLRHIYMNAIKGIHQAAEFTLSQPDYIPHTHLPTYPRTNIHFPATQEELELGWAYKATVRKEPPVEFVDEDDVDSHEEQAVLNMKHTPGDAFSNKDKQTAGEQAKEGGVNQDPADQPDVQGNAKPLHETGSRPSKKTRRRAPMIKDNRVTIKDMVMLTDVPCLFGAEVQDEGEFVSDMDATCVTRILDEGGVILGKANCEMSILGVFA